MGLAHPQRPVCEPKDSEQSLSTCETGCDERNRTRALGAFPLRTLILTRPSLRSKPRCRLWCELQAAAPAPGSRAEMRCAWRLLPCAGECGQRGHPLPCARSMVSVQALLGEGTRAAGPVPERGHGAECSRCHQSCSAQPGLPRCPARGGAVPAIYRSLLQV